MRHVRLILLALLLPVSFGADSASAETFVSSQGEFYFVYPEDWNQIDYNTVDYYLSVSAADSQAFDYEAAFAPDSSRPFHSGNYLILTFDEVGRLTDRQIDSVVNELSRSFDGNVSYLPTDDFLADLSSESVNYDRTKKLVSVLSNVFNQGEVARKNLWIMRFCEKGIANFYFYSPVSSFRQSKAQFETILNSFSTENIEAAMPQETLKLADIETDDDDSGITGVALIILAAIIVLLAVVIGMRRKTRSRT
jgi:hypothetical protein